MPPSKNTDQAEKSDDKLCPRCKNSNEDSRTGLSAETLRRAFLNHLYYVQGKFGAIATPNDHYMALAYAVRDRLLRRWICTTQTYLKKDVRLVAYLSAEFLVGPHLYNNLINLGIVDEMREALNSCGVDLEDMRYQEREPGLGNGGLGRLAACYMDSLSTLDMPAIGDVMRYEFGIFEQIIREGWQVELTDKGLQLGNPWEIARPENSCEVKFGGHTEQYRNQHGRLCVRWFPDYVVKGIPYDTPISGYRVNTVNMLRLWKAEASESFDFQNFNTGDYYGAVDDKVNAENLTKVLYPNDEQVQGKELRLKQQYFFVACSLQDMIRIHLFNSANMDGFHQSFAAQLNDTHPSIAIPELMRLLMDDYCYDWVPAWTITQQTFAYTNHTLLPEAMEKWSIELLGRLLPRHLEIIYEINRRLLDQVRIKYPDNDDRLARMSLIDENGERYVRMANLACTGSHAINGVAQLHTELLKTKTLSDFYRLMPEKFSNKTNGVTPRRWMVLSNPKMSELISEAIGDSWITDLDQLKGLEPLVEDSAFCQAWRSIKLDNKRVQTDNYHKYSSITVNPESMFDVQVKRLHEYKRQHLNLLHIITLYNRIKQNPSIEMTPRTFIFGGKAAPGYWMAKLIIKLIHSVAEVINQDPEVEERLKIIFIPNFNVKRGHRIYPIADLSEQISTAGKEASGTGNMKFSMNGALTIGTLDGANIEIRDAVGSDNFFLFGHTAEEVETLKLSGYSPLDYYQSDDELRGAIDLISKGFFSHGDPELFKPLVDSLLYDDPYLLLADYRSYIDCQQQVNEVFVDHSRWTRMSILNVARMGRFSSDRSIAEYCRDIWRVKPVQINLEESVPEPFATRRAVNKN